MEKINEQPSAFDWLETEISAVDCWYRGDPSYEHDAHWMKERALELVQEAKAIFAPGVEADALMALELIAAEDDAARHNGKLLLTSGVRLALDAALIKAGRKAAPEKMRHITIAGVD
ncbi:hypothetical protein SAMN03159335_05428 [Burkholderia cepacia]|uniref:hypothetical protein n=1 Tax=Burkholderia cepacia TaxID=292 RepID=UPI0008D13E76|nr:hypothetical protein [Burkholderia cepacia]SEU36344.1 hypothetical protein SAMN03159335_05428 [Burkholderia cepacia]